MIVYYDVLMIDDESLLPVKHSERFQRLKDLITPITGRSALVKREIIDCGRRSAASDLRRAFAKCITARGEGLVLKADDPYFDWDPSRRPYSCCAIKLKKEYIGNFGDIGDFAVVGARFDAARARTYNIPRLKWTHFYVGCLENKDEARRFGKQPRFVVTNVVELNATQLEAFIFSVNPEYVPAENNTAISLRIEPGIDNGKRPSVIFPVPPVVDLRCFSFDKEGNTGFWSPRFPSVTKIHCDRTCHDVLSFAELQDMAIKEKEAPPPEDSQELLGWIAALENSELRAAGDETSQSTVSIATAPATPSHQLSQPGRRGILFTPPSPKAKEPDSTREHRAVPVGGRSKSSAVQAPESTAPSPTGKKQTALGHKRPYEVSPQNNTQERIKMRRCSSDHVATVYSSQSNDASFTTQRLVDTQADPSRRHSTAHLPMPRSSTSTSMRRSYSENKDGGERDSAQCSVQSSQSFYETVAPVPVASPPFTEVNTASTEKNPPRPSTVSPDTNPGRCRYLPASCKLSTYSFLLSPCISDFPWVAEDLLSAHGVTDFIRDPKAWLEKSSSTADTTNRRRRKIALVDARRREATDAFLHSIQDAKLTRRNGEREYVPVYDWRVLETLMEEERKCGHKRERAGARFDVASGQSIWRRFWVGLA